MAYVLHGYGNGDQLNVTADKTQVYGLSGNDTLTSDGKSEVLLIGGSGDDSLIIKGGNGTLSGGKGADTFEFLYSAANGISAVIEDLDSTQDKIVINFDGETAPQLSSLTSGDDVIWTDSNGLFNVTLKSVRENNYFDGTADDNAWEVLKLTNDEREVKGLSLLTMSEGLTEGATIRAQEISGLAELGVLTNHTRPESVGSTPWYTVLEDKYNFPGENLEAGAPSAVSVMTAWMGSEHHRENILDERFNKLGVGYYYHDAGGNSAYRYHWVQLFADSLVSTERETVASEELLSVIPQVNAVSKFIPLSDSPDIYSNSDYGATIAALGGADSIENYGLLVSISGGDADDTVYNYGGNEVAISGDAGDDLILTRGANVTITGGKGDDLIGLSGNASEAQNNLIIYNAGDGNDTIALNSTSTLRISGDEYTPVTVGTNVMVSVGNDLIELRNAAYLSNLNIEGTRSKWFILADGSNYLSNTVESASIQAVGIRNYYINNWGESAIIYGYFGNDTVTNWAANSTINGSAGNDSLRSNGASALVEGGGDNDYLNAAMGPNVTISGGNGNDSVFNNMLSHNAKIFGGNGDDSIQNGGFYPTIAGGAGNDTILNAEYGLAASIDGGASNDSIDNWGGTSVTINGGEGNDTLNNIGSFASIGGGSGNDGVNNYSGSTSIDLGAGNDSIYNEGSFVTIVGGLDNDLILLSNDDALNNLIKYESGDSRDTIYGFNEDDTLEIGGGSGTYSTLENGNNIIVNVGTGSILLMNAASLSSVVNIEGALKEHSEQSNENTFIRLTETPANYTNTLEGAIIQALEGDDSITNTGNNAAVSGEEGDDTIDNEGNNVAIFGREGNDEIWNKGSNVSISSDEGTNFIVNEGENVLIFGGDDNDSIYQGGSNGVIISESGDDEIILFSNATNNLIRYSSGDGNDTIQGFGTNDTLLLITDPSNYSTQISGNDVVVNVGSESVALLKVYDAESGELTALNIVVASGGSTSGGSSMEDKYIPLTEGDDNYTNMATGVTIAALGGNDSVTNYGSNVSIDGGNDNNTLSNRGLNNTLTGGAGKDSIHNSGSSAVIESGDDDDIIYTNSNATINSGDGNNSIRSGSQDPVSIVSGAGNDTIYNGNGGRNYPDYPDGDNATIESGAGDDSIVNYGWSVAINTGDGKDHIDNFGLSVTIDAGADNDFISS